MANTFRTNGRTPKYPPGIPISFHKPVFTYLTSLIPTQINPASLRTRPAIKSSLNVNASVFTPTNTDPRNPTTGLRTVIAPSGPPVTPIPTGPHAMQDGSQRLNDASFQPGFYNNVPARTTKHVPNTVWAAQNSKAFRDAPVKVIGFENMKGEAAVQQIREATLAREREERAVGRGGRPVRAVILPPTWRDCEGLTEAERAFVIQRNTRAKTEELNAREKRLAFQREVARKLEAETTHTANFAHASQASSNVKNRTSVEAPLPDHGGPAASLTYSRSTLSPISIETRMDEVDLIELDSEDEVEGDGNYGQPETLRELVAGSLREELCLDELFAPLLPQPGPFSRFRNAAVLRCEELVRLSAASAYGGPAISDSLL